MQRVKVRDVSRALGFALLTLVCLAGCRSHKQAVAREEVHGDSVSVSRGFRELVVADSVIRSMSFAFDSLVVESGAARLETEPGSVERRVRLYGGSLGSTTQGRRASKSRELRADSVGVKLRAAREQQSRAEVTAVAEPPNLTLVWLGLGLVVGLVVVVGLVRRGGQG